MESFSTLPAETTPAHPSLRTLVSNLVKELVPAAARNSSFVINDVPEELKLAADTETVRRVLGTLFTTVASHASDSCIRVTAKTYSDVILVQLRDRGTNGSTLAYNLQSAQPVAEKIGGFLGVTSRWSNETVIVFSFPNLPLAA